MPVEGFADRVSPTHVEVRNVGACVFEARTRGGAFSAVGVSSREAIQNLRNRLPLFIEDVPLPKPTSD